MASVIGEPSALWLNQPTFSPYWQRLVPIFVLLPVASANFRLAAQQQAGALPQPQAHQPTQPGQVPIPPLGAYHGLQAPNPQPVPGYPGLPQPTNAGTFDLSSIRPVNTGSLNLSDVAKARNFATEKSAYDANQSGTATPIAAPTGMCTDTG